VLPRLRAPEPADPALFLWAAGIEDTFIIDPWPATGRILDEYALTHHDTLWRDDLARLASLGVRVARYGIPWYRIQPAPDRWDWSFADRALAELGRYGVEVILDLVHYGTPPWLERSFLSPDYPSRVAEYAARAGERYRGCVRWFTPLNEPRITAWYAGRIGHWPPYARGWRGFVAVMLALCRGICRTGAALRAVAPEAVLVHVDAGDRYVTADPDLAEEVARRQAIGFLALDLVSGRVDERHALWPWLQSLGVTPESLAWFREHAVPLDVVGVNAYPMYPLKQLLRTPRGLRIRMPYATAETLRWLLAAYAARYRRPVMITETAAAGSVARRARWLDDSIAVVRALRSVGIPVIGYTWWPIYGLVGWAYRTGTRELIEYVVQMGLWDLRADERGELTRRVATPLVARFRSYVARGLEAVGRMGAARL